MRKILTIGFCMLLWVSKLVAQKIQFPESFKCGSTFFKGMKIADIPKKIQDRTGIQKSPSVVSSTDGKNFLMKRIDVSNISDVYFEVYQGKLDEDDDAGVVVARFNDVDGLNKEIPELRYQDNNAFLRIDNYLITVWSDESKGPESTIQSLVAYFQKKLGAQLLIAPKKDVEEAEIESTVSEPEYGSVAIPASPGTFTQIGFGNFRTDLMKANELATLQAYARKIKERYDVEIAIESIGNSDLQELTPIDEHLPGYVSHLVWTDEGRKKNNIVLLVDEVLNRSWIFFGTNNKKYYPSKEIAAIEARLNLSLNKKQLYRGIYFALEALEILQITGLDQSAKTTSSEMGIYPDAQFSNTINKNKKLLHVLVTVSGLMGFFDDATVTECRSCSLNPKAGIESLLSSNPIGVYSTEGTTIAFIKAKESESVEFFNLPKGKADKSWLMIDG